MSTLVREVSLFRNGRNQALRVPREFELAGESAFMYQDGARLVIEPKFGTAAELLASWDDLDVAFPPIEDALAVDEDIF